MASALNISFPVHFFNGDRLILFVLISTLMEQRLFIYS
jgi:hypothetical protein